MKNAVDFPSQVPSNSSEQVSKSQSLPSPDTQNTSPKAKAQALSRFLQGRGLRCKADLYTVRDNRVLDRRRHRAKETLRVASAFPKDRQTWSFTKAPKVCFYDTLEHSERSQREGKQAKSKKPRHTWTMLKVSALLSVFGNSSFLLCAFKVLALHSSSPFLLFASTILLEPLPSSFSQAPSRSGAALSDL